MKKTLNTNIAGIIFALEEDAYTALETYLKEIRDYFASYQGRDEIVADIESRIAEQFLQNAGPNKIVGMAQVHELIKIMGKPSDFDKESPGQDAGASAPNVKKRLFRNTDDAVIAGVASGIAAYLEPDAKHLRTATIIIRLIFVAIVLAGGSGIVLYILLWIVLPEAKTSVDKLEMRGGSLREMIGQYARSVHGENIKNEIGHTASRFGGFLKKCTVGLFGVVGFIARIVCKILGAAIIAVSFIGLLALTSAFVNLIFNPHSVYVDPVISQIALVSPLLYYSALVLFYIAAAVVLVSFWIIGLVVYKLRAVASARAIIGLVVLFGVIVVAGSILFFNYSPQYMELIKEFPQSQRYTRMETFPSFTKIEVDGSSHVHLVQGKNSAAVITGRKSDLDDMNFFVKNDTLVIGRSSRLHICIICLQDDVQVALSMPSIESITVFGSGSVESGTFTSTGTLQLAVTGSGSILASTTAQSVIANINGSGHIALTGNAEGTTVAIVGSGYYDGFALATRTAKISLFGSGIAEVAPTETLAAAVTGSGAVVYKGTPKVITDVHGSGTVGPMAQ